MSVSLMIDSQRVEVEENTTILDAAKKAGIEIPTLCYLENINKNTSCRMCIVDTGGGRLSPACSTPVRDGMEVKTATKKIKEIRKTILELLLANHNSDCTMCVRNGDCELQNLANKYGVDENPFRKTYTVYQDTKPKAVNRDLSKCIKCGRCISVCENVQGVRAISYINRSDKTQIAPPYNDSLMHSNCIACGQCIASCPVGALYESKKLSDIYSALAEDTYYNVCLISHQSAEALGKGLGVDSMVARNKVVNVLKSLGFSMVLDLEEYLIGEINRISLTLKESMAHEVPLLYACSPGIKKQIVKNVPESKDLFIDLEQVREDINIPFKENLLDRGVDKDVHLVRVENCTALLAEENNGYDLTITTRQLIRLLESACVNFENYEGVGFDSLERTGEFNPFYLAIQTAYDIIRLNDSSGVDNRIGFKREFNVKLTDDRDIKGCIVFGLNPSIEEIKRAVNKENDYDFIGVMSCVDGCVNGGGRPNKKLKK